LNLSTLYLALSTIGEELSKNELQQSINLKGLLINSESLKELSKEVTGNGISINSDDVNKLFVDEILNSLKPYLDKSNGISINELISLFESFPSTIQKYLASKFTEVPVSNIENSIDKTISKRKNNPSDADKYGEALYKSTKDDFDLLKELMGYSNVQYQMLADKVANEILQCSIDFFNYRQETDSDDFFETNLNTSIKLVKIADSVAISDQIKERAKENISTLLGMKDREINQAIDLLQSIKDAYKANEVKIRQQVKIQEASLGYGQSINWTKVNELIKDSLDWDKVIELILNAIPSKNINKIQNINDTSKLNLFKELVEFVFDKMSYSNKNRIKYLRYWKPVNTPIKTKTTSSTSCNSNSSSDKTGCIVLVVIGVVIAIIVAVSNSNNSSSSYSNNNSSSLNTYSTQSNNSDDDKVLSTYSIPTESKYKGNRLKNGSSPYNAFFGAGAYNKGHQNWITFKNGYQTDAIVCLVNYYSGKTIRNEYIQAGTSFQMTNLPNGTYYMKVFSGKDWNPTKSLANGKIKGGFDTEESFYQSKDYKDLLQLKDDGYQYSTGEITLYKVSNGNMQTQQMSENSFFN
jgi:hypothetical protein